MIVLHVHIAQWLLARKTRFAICRSTEPHAIDGGIDMLRRHRALLHHRHVHEAPVRNSLIA